ncbi:MAG: ATP-binding protein, partial [Gammaproteobacteria bacterium]|nr:ATP-binding protein [Gammaproteobacteria bacterium]
GDERDFMDLFGNIMENAFKYTHDRVRVTASADSRPTVRIEDDGPGIDPDIRGQVIDRGIRADRAQPGQGIGLAVVAELTALYNGSLEIGSSPLGGASVKVTL